MDIQINSQQKILVVEDEYLLGEALVRKLRELGFQNITLAMGLQEAIEVIIRDKPKLILLDIQLGNNYDGFKLAEKLRYQHSIPFIFISSHSDNKITEQARTYQPYGYLLKPVNKENLRIAIEMALYRAAYEDVSQQERERKALLELSHTFASVRQKEDLLQVIIETLKPLFKFDDAVVNVWEDNGAKLRMLTSDQSSNAPQNPNYKLFRQGAFPIKGTPYEEIYNCNEPTFFYLSKQLEKYPDFPGIKIMEEEGYSTDLILPLWQGGNKIGIFELHSKKEGYLESINLELLKGVTDQIAVAVSNIQANEEILARQKEKEILLGISNAIASLRKKEDLFRFVIEKLKPVFRFHDSLNIYTIDPDGKHYRFFFNALNIEELHTNGKLDKKYSVKDPIFSLVCKSKDPILIDPDKMLEKLPGHWGLETMKHLGIKETMMAAMMVRGKVIGICSVHSMKKNWFKKEQLSLFQMVANQIATAVSNILAYEKIQKNASLKTIQVKITDILNNNAPQSGKYQALIPLLQFIIPFDLIAFGLNHKDSTQSMAYERIGYEEYRFISTEHLMNRTQWSEEAITDIIQGFDYSKINYANEEDFKLECKSRPLLAMVRKFFQIQSYLNFPFPLSKSNNYWVIFFSKKTNTFRQEHLNILEQFSSSIKVTLEKQLAYQKIEKLSDLLKQEKAYLEEEIKVNNNFEEIVGSSKELQSVFKKVSQVAYTDSTVLITGESGTGKELIARAIHNLSSRNKKPLIKINCANLPPQLIESELFGHEKGSFTGAIERRIGKFELADKGTIFLDEIGELPLALQAKLLRVLQERSFERLGSNQVLNSDVRIIAATNRDLEKEITAGKFRADLFFRLIVFPISLPPLRDRKEDITSLALHFLRKASRKLGKKISGISNAALKELMAYDWPGNVRELEHVIERAVILNQGPTLNLSLEKMKITPTEWNAPKGPFQFRTIKEAERELILKTLEFCGGRVRGRGGAAEILDINPATLDSRMKKLGIEKRHIFKGGKN